MDIHRKPGFDPLKLFFDMKTKKISHDTSLVHGSHGIIDNENSKLPIIGTTISEKKLPEKLRKDAQASKEAANKKKKTFNNFWK